MKSKLTLICLPFSFGTAPRFSCHRVTEQKFQLLLLAYDTFDFSELHKAILIGEAVLIKIEGTQYV